MLKVYIYKVEDKVNMKGLPKVVINHVNKYTNKQAKTLSAFAWTKACKLLADYDFKFKNLSFDKNEQPKITNSKIFFNISHSQKYIAIAISDCPVGVDIQHELTKQQVEALIQMGMVDKKDGEEPILEFCKFEAWYKMNNFVKQIKPGKKQFNTFHLLIEKSPYALIIINEANDKISFKELKYGALKIKNINL